MDEGERGCLPEPHDKPYYTNPIVWLNYCTKDEAKGQVLIFLNFLYVHGNCTAVIRFFHESMHGNYPDASKISMHVKSLLQTRIMHGMLFELSHTSACTIYHTSNFCCPKINRVFWIGMHVLELLVPECLCRLRAPSQKSSQLSEKYRVD